jgi:hypothetical protein
MNFSNPKKKTLGSGKGGMKFQGKDEDEEDAFLAKPRIMRTPPPASAQKRIN